MLCMPPLELFLRGAVVCNIKTPITETGMSSVLVWYGPREKHQNTICNITRLANYASTVLCASWICCNGHSDTPPISGATELTINQSINQTFVHNNMSRTNQRHITIQYNTLCLKKTYGCKWPNYDFCISQGSVAIL